LHPLAHTIDGDILAAQPSFEPGREATEIHPHLLRDFHRAPHHFACVVRGSPLAATPSGGAVFARDWLRSASKRSRSLKASPLCFTNCAYWACIFVSVAAIAP